MAECSLLEKEVSHLSICSIFATNKIENTHSVSSTCCLF
jgi:hypothetical protein